MYLTYHKVLENHEIRIWRRATRGNHNPPLIFMKLNLYAIEITPERTPGVGEYWPTRDIILYYGWTKITNKYFWHTLCEWNQYNNELSPGYY